MTTMYERTSSENKMLDARKRRRCLICTSLFMSEWSGERVCRGCKGKAIWRQGTGWPTTWSE
jgi:hypothetical protein